MKIKDPEFYFMQYGFLYAHSRSPWIFNIICRLNNFKFGFDWYFNKWRLDEMSIYLGFFEINWTRVEI